MNSAENSQTVSFEYAPSDLREVNASLAHFSSLIKGRRSDERHGLDGSELCRITLDFLSNDGALLYLGYLLGKGVEFTIDDRGMQIMVKNPKQLLAILRRLAGGK